MIHDRLPFFDLLDGAVLHDGVDTVPIRRRRRRQQVGVSLRGSAIASVLDLSGWPFLFLATIASAPLLYFGMAVITFPIYSEVVTL